MITAPHPAVAPAVMINIPPDFVLTVTGVIGFVPCPIIGHWCIAPITAIGFPPALTPVIGDDMICPP